MTELAADGNIAEIDDADGEEASRIGDYLASHGGPFFELQRRLGMLREDALLAGRRAALFVALAWGVPFLLSLVAGRAFSLPDGRAYLVDFGAWARFFIAIGLFMLSEQQIEYGLNGKLGHLVRAPMIAPECFEAAASAVVRALRLRDSRAAEIICLGLAIVGTLAWLSRLTISGHSSWAVQIAGDRAHVTLAGWWSVICSAPLFYFLLFRGLWRYIVWAMLLWRIASLKLRLVATHPDGKGGLAFLAEYPNAYSMFVFGVSSGFAITVVRHVFEAISRRSHSASSSPRGWRSCSRSSPFRCWRSPNLWPSSRTDRPKSSAPRRPATTAPRSAPWSDATSSPTIPWKRRRPPSLIRRRNSPLRANCRSFS
ncbi:MAG TPA: hypothetical protein VGG79_18575 [Roseiarcus sp.]|jgi:hypothetical protein